MPDCEFNEREFEAAVNYELIAAWRSYLVGGLPTQPSQFAEKALGYDAAYKFKRGRRIFLQYKVAFSAERRTGTNVDLFNAWGGPYLRADLLMDKKSREPHQHNRLVALAASGEDVFYCAPLFHELSTLGAHAESKAVWRNSLQAPLKGAPMLSEGPHSLSYPPTGVSWRLHSEIGEERDVAVDVFSRSVFRPFNREAFAELATGMRSFLDVAGNLEIPEVTVERGPLAEIDWLLSRYLGAVLILLPDRAA
jgi:hypothetical protein